MSYALNTSALEERHTIKYVCNAHQDSETMEAANETQVEVTPITALSLEIL